MIRSLRPALFLAAVLALSLGLPQAERLPAAFAGANEDIFVFTPSTLGSTTAGTYSFTLFFDGSVYGLGPNNIVGLDLP